MSGGYFDYNQHKINDIAEGITSLIESNDSTEKDEWGEDIGHHYPEHIIAKFKETKAMCERLAHRVHSVDLLVCGDIGEDSFEERWSDDSV